MLADGGVRFNAVRIRKGDWFIVAGCAVIAVWERTVVDDADLISRRVSAYRTTRHGRVVADAVILATALHLAEQLPPDLDVYCWLMRWVRKTADKAEVLIDDIAA